MGDALSLWLFPVRTGLNLAGLLAIGLALHTALGIVEPVGRKTLLSIGLAAAAAVLLFAAARLAVLYAQMGDGAFAFDPDLFALSWLALGPSTLCLAIGAGAIAAGLVSGFRLLAGLGAVVLAAGFALTGHVQALEAPGLAPFGVALHVFIAGFWTAAPLTLYPSAGLSDTTLYARLARFSAYALWLIPVLLALGIWLAIDLTGGPEALLTTSYGRLLLLKLALALVAMAIGALNQWVVTARVKRESEIGRRWLRRTLAIETILFASAVLSVSAATTLTGPGE